MQIGALLGPEEFLKYQKIFNFGATTGIDLPGEATGILHTEESLSSGSTELASASFGQGYTCTMIQEIAAICSVINGGYYYQPHVVSKILNEDGDVIKDVQPVVTKQTVSSDVSALIRQYMGTVMESDGTGAAAKVDGYSMGGKTGTAQKYPREEKNIWYHLSVSHRWMIRRWLCMWLLTNQIQNIRQTACMHSIFIKVL